MNKKIIVLFNLLFYTSFADSLSTLIVEREIGNFNDAISLSISVSGQIFILDAGTSSLISIDYLSGKTNSISGKGWRELEFNSPNDVCGTSVLDIFVADLNNRRIQHFDRSLNFISTIPTAENEIETFQPIAIQFSQEGFLLILDKDEKQVLKYDLKSKKFTKLVQFTSGKGLISDPLDLAIINKNNFAVLNGKQILIYDIYGNFINSFSINIQESPLTLFSSENKIAVTSKNQIIIYSNSGKILDQIKPLNIIGKKAADFRDISIIDENYFILTKNSILICSKK
ncbi:MAG: hypothetical protein O3A55_02505 [Bacteroidetes bacterium]|nr:hypothetical protein [Bacteroidota bacterium]